MSLDYMLNAVTRHPLEYPVKSTAFTAHSDTFQLHGQFLGSCHKIIHLVEFKNAFLSKILLGERGKSTFHYLFMQKYTCSETGFT